MYEKQMELFEDGGLRDEGGMVDEESGNEVPVGSTRKEVRDDIPAMLSEGEFVFPADVVRYIGLENLMRIRQDAKQGLKQMEAMGQMGNGDEAVLPDDMPFGMMDLIIIEGEEEEPQEKAQGGVIHANQGTFVTPMFDPSNQDVREYKNEAGNSLFIPFLGGEPVYPIPAGYFPVGQMPDKTETEEAIPTGGDDDDTPPPPQSEFQKAGGFGMDTSATDGKALDMWIKEAEKVSTFGNVAAGIGAAINPLMGGMIAMANKRQKKEIIDMLDEKIAQARKTPIEGQVAALQEVKKRLTTKEGQSILGKVISEITGTVTDALGLTEEEKKTAKIGGKINAGQSPNEPDEVTKKGLDIGLKAQKLLNLTPEQIDKIDFEAAIKKAGQDLGVSASVDDLAKAVAQNYEATAPDMAFGPQTRGGPAKVEAPETPVAIPTSSYDEVPTRTDVETAKALKSTAAPEAPQMAVPAGLRGPKLGEGDIEQTDIDMLKYDTTSFYSDKKSPTTPALGSEEGQPMTRPKFEAPIPPQYQELRTVLDDLRESTAYRGPVSGMTMPEKIEDPLGPFIGAGKFEDLTNKVAEAVKPYATDRKPKPPTVPTKSPKPSSGDNDKPTFAPTPTSTQTEEQAEQTQAAVEKAKETLTSGERMGSAELDKTFGISGLKSGGLASRKKKKK